uniref:Uncharacterized protein n=1 Tax=Meloidogyne enterolobii TaxID=390850 RepID=A0A6V7XU46_MELEN|nr:unnamed protein product [Meloidogyne enterolobii]
MKSFNSLSILLLLLLHNTFEAFFLNYCLALPFFVHFKRFYIAKIFLFCKYIFIFLLLGNLVPQYFYAEFLCKIYLFIY